MKRVAALRDLSDDHHTALVLARRCRQSAGSEAQSLWKLVRETFVLHLDPHFRIEDVHLLPALDSIGEAELAQRIRDDHAALRAAASDAGSDAEALVRFGERLDAHVRFEERQVFGPTQDRLPDAALAAIARACREIPRSCPAPLEPGAARPR